MEFIGTKDLKLVCEKTGMQILRSALGGFRSG